jgi:hypothetical protein
VRHRSKFAIAAIVFAILGAGAAGAPAAQVVVIGPGQQATVGGWSIASPAGVSLTASTTNSTLTLEKFAAFTSMTPASISFTRLDDADSIDITTEMITNETGSNWTGFTFSLTGAGATFDSIGNSFIPPVGTSPLNSYTNISFSPTSITYTGTQNNGFTSSWGGEDGSEIVIDAAGTSFSLIESPVGHAVAVPLPSAALDGSAALGALGLVACANRLKRRLLS